MLPRYGNDDGTAGQSIPTPPALTPQHQGSSGRETWHRGTHGTAAGPGRGRPAESRTEELSAQPGRGPVPALAMLPQGQRGEGIC